MSPTATDLPCRPYASGAVARFDFNHVRLYFPARLPCEPRRSLGYQSPGPCVVGGIRGFGEPPFGEPAAQALRPHSQEPLHVRQGGGGHVDPAVEVFDPIDRNLAYAQAALLGQQEQLGVEEPLAVLDLRQELLCNAALDRLEAALGVGEVVAEEDLYKEVVAARD